MSIWLIDFNITDEYSVNCDFILNTVTFIDAALNILLRKIWKCNALSFYLFDQGVPNETKGTINLKSRHYFSGKHDVVTDGIMTLRTSNQVLCNVRSYDFYGMTLATE